MNKEYYNNLNEILVKEYLIETMEKNIQELEEKSEPYNKHYISVFFF